MNLRRWLGVLLLVLLLPALGRAADVRATLDRHSVQLGETVTLNLHIQGAAGDNDTPDLGALERDFEVLGTSQNRSLSIVNGVRHAELTFGVALRPRHAGALQIPALTVAGAQTLPLPLQVSVPAANAAAAARQDVFMEAQVTPAHAYVGQQLSYVVRLYYAITLSGSLATPQVDGAEISQVGDDVKYLAERGGRQYRVLERRYALVPQQAGHLSIPAANFQGEAADPNDPDSFFGASTPLAASAPAVSAEVQAPPADWGKAAWLPARQLSLTLEGLPDAQHPPRVGQPLNLTMNLQATGLPPEALPALSLPPLAGATVYPDKPVSATRNDGQWLLGQRQQAFAIVPERAGALTIPATTLRWWNVLTDKPEVAQVPAYSVTVLPAAGTTVAPPGNVDGAPAGSVGAGSTAAPAATIARVVPWRWLALGSVGLWLLSVLAWLRWRRRPRVQKPLAPPTPPRASTQQLQQAFLAATRGHDVTAQVHTLLAWARAERPALQHLGELSAALGDASQRAAIARLQQRHYAAAPDTVDDTTLAQAFKRGFVWRTDATGDEEASLPPLYPFKLR
jgi:hypothetical protein